MRTTRKHGRLRLQLEPAEAQLLGVLFDDLDALLDAEGADPGDEVLRRLNPAAYPDDAAAQEQYLELTAQSLRTEREERMAACRAEIATSTDVDLSDPDAGRRWLQVLNDLRLALGTRLGITEQDEPDIDPNDPGAQPRLVYYWLTTVQDSLVRGMMR